MMDKVVKISRAGIDFIKGFEGLRLKAYLDITGLPTVGYGSIYHSNGTPVKMGDVITNDEAEILLLNEATKKVNAILKLTKGIELTQNQLDALASFVYNLGEGAFSQSTLLRKMKVNPNDPSIAQEFEKWCKARIKGVLKVDSGLSKRRKKESILYFTK